MVHVIQIVIMQHAIMIMVIVNPVHLQLKQVQLDPHHLPIVLLRRRLRLLLRHTHVQMELVVNGIHLVVAIGDIYQRRV